MVTLDTFVDTLFSVSGGLALVICIVIGAAIIYANHETAESKILYAVGAIFIAVGIVWFAQELGIFNIWPFEWYGLNGEAETPVIA